MDHQQGPTVEHTGNSAKCYVAAWVGGEFGEWIHIYAWLSPFTVHLETIATLLISYQFSSVQSLSRVQLFATP